MTTSSRLGGLVLLALAGCGGEPSAEAPDPAAASNPLAEAALVQWHLPRRLREISGLAFTADQRLLAVADEEAQVVEVDWQQGRQVKRFRLGNPAVLGDFEGIACHLARCWLVTSDGELYSFAEGDDGAAVSYRRYSTGAGKLCEVEGLDVLADGSALVLACKNPRSKALKKQVALLQVALVDGEPGQAEPWLRWPEKTFAGELDGKDFQPSGVALVGGEIWLVAARQRALARVSTAGEVLSVRRFPAARRHPQAEGLAVAAGGELLVADEGGEGRGMLGRYPPQPEALAALARTPGGQP